MLGNTRSGTTCDPGAFELQVAAVGTYDDESSFERLAEVMREGGFEVLKPRIDPG